MADTQSHKQGVIRSTQVYLQAPDSLGPEALAPDSLESPAPESPVDSDDARVPSPISTISGDDDASSVSTARENPREVRNRAEKMRRDRLNQSVAELALMVPPVVAACRKIDKTTVLRLTAHYLRAHQYVFGDSIGQSTEPFNPASILKVLNMFNGFLITTTYKGIIVVVSQNVNQYLGYTEIDLLGQNLLTITHEGDRAMLRDQLMPRSQTLGPNGELIIPDEPDATRKVEEALAHETRRFVIRLKKLGQRSEPSQYITCHVEGSLRKSDQACRSDSRCCRIVRRARARSENPCSSGNDIVFIGIMRPTSETFINESALEAYRMEYRTRHSIDGEIIQCDARIAIVTGYMTHEVSGVNAMNFMHRDDVRWVIIALREMYDQHRMFGESCYRLITKNGQFIYMRTRGCLDVDRDTRAVTSFVCTNTVVDEDEGKQLIKLMKKKFTLLVNNNEASFSIEEIDDDTNDNGDQNSDQPAPVEDPRRLEKVILHLVTNLPSPSPQDDEDDPFAGTSPKRKAISPHRLTIIPPNKERIVSAIEKIYSVFHILQKDCNHDDNNYDEKNTTSSRQTIPQYTQPVEINSFSAQQEAQIVPYQGRHVSNYVQAPDSAPVEPMAYNINENNYEQMSSSGSSHTSPQYTQPVEMNSFPATQEPQIVPYQSRNVSNYVHSSENVPVEPMAYNINDYNYEQMSSSGSNHTSPQYMQSLEMNSFPAPQEAQIVPHQNHHVCNYVQATDSALVQPIVYNINYNNYDQSSSSDWSHTTLQYMQSAEMNNFSAPQEAQIVPYQRPHVSDYVNAPDSASVESMAYSINDNNSDQSSTSDWRHTTPQYMQSVEMDGFPAPQEQFLSYETQHDSNYVQAPDTARVEPMACNINEGDFNVDEMLEAVASSDIGYLDTSEGTFSNLSQLLDNFAQHGEMFNDQQIADLQESEYHGAESTMTIPMSRFAEEPNMLQALPQTSTSNFPCGIKRPNDFEDFDMVYKKKITESEFIRKTEKTSEFESSLECLFDLSCFDSIQLELAINSTEYIDPMLSDKLRSVDVTAVLNEIELEAKQDRLRELEQLQCE